MQASRIIGLLTIGSLLCGHAMAVPTLPPFINELHYDNAGSDTGEFIELAGTAQSLLGFSIVLYNGGTGRSYRNVPLTEEIPNQSRGFGSVAISVAGLQNGPADGIALVDAMSRVVDWLSYEGEILALDGPAEGMLSSALSVFQTSASPVGSSLQRIGVGVSGPDFGWVGPLPSSPGSINTGQRFLPEATAVPEPNPLLLTGLGLVLVGVVTRPRLASRSSMASSLRC